MYAEAILKKGEGRTLKSGGAWVYDNEIDRVEGDYENGDILAVKDFDCLLYTSYRSKELYQEA